MAFNFYTDLAIERKGAHGLSEGFSFQEEKSGVFKKTLLKIETEEAARLLEKPKGRYYSLSFPSPLSLSEAEGARLSKETAMLLRRLSPPMAKRLLVVGLGNRHMTADAVGPLVTDGVIPTAHLIKEAPALFPSSPSVFVCAPGVRAQSGMEATETVNALCQALRPDFVLAIDALAARSPERLLTTVQISDTGISPGSGIGSVQGALSQESLGIPVLALGVPTVINAAAFVKAALGDAADEAETQPEGAAVEKELFVSPKTLDTELSLLSPLLSDAINSAYGI